MCEFSDLQQHYLFWYECEYHTCIVCDSACTCTCIFSLFPRSRSRTRSPRRRSRSYSPRRRLSYLPPSLLTPYPITLPASLAPTPSHSITSCTLPPLTPSITCTLAPSSYSTHHFSHFVPHTPPISLLTLYLLILPPSLLTPSSLTGLSLALPEGGVIHVPQFVDGSDPIPALPFQGGVCVSVSVCVSVGERE